MDSRTDQKSSQPVDASGRAPRKRFRIEKLEERIAPKKGGQTKGGGGGGGADSGASGSTGTSVLVSTVGIY